MVYICRKTVFDLYKLLFQELRELVLKYREDIISVRTAADHLEEKLKAEILFLKEQIQAEQCLKENIEETLQLEIENCKEEIGETRALFIFKHLSGNSTCLPNLLVLPT